MNKTEIQNLMKSVWELTVKDFVNNMMGHREDNLNATLYFHLRKELENQIADNGIRIIREYHCLEKDKKRLDICVKKVGKIDSKFKSSKYIHNWSLEEARPNLLFLETKFLRFHHYKNFKRDVKEDYQKMVDVYRNTDEGCKLGYFCHISYSKNEKFFEEKKKNPMLITPHWRYKNFYHEAWCYCLDVEEPSQFKIISGIDNKPFNLDLT